MDALESAKAELKACIEEIERHYASILDTVEKIDGVTLPELLNATPTVQGKNAILKKWHPMLLDLGNGLHVLNQGIDQAHKQIL